MGRRKQNRFPLWGLMLLGVLSLAAALITGGPPGEWHLSVQGEDLPVAASPDLLGKLEGPLAEWAKQGSPGPIAVVVVLQKGADPEPVKMEIKRLGGKVTTQFESNIYAEVPSAALPPLAGHPQVWGIRPTPVHHRLDPK